MPLAAIVGRPNVGKSMLFNRLVGRRVSIVEDTPGVTRDRIYAETEWNGREFHLVDTGGIEPNTKDEMLRFMREQAEIAIQNADVIIFLADIKTGVTAADEEVAAMLRRSGKPVVLAVNKCDKPGAPPAEIYEYYSLSLGDPLPVSAFHGHGTGDLLDVCVSHFPVDEARETEEAAIHVAVIGKPNVGKSSLVNRVLGEERTIVSDVPGTTRDAIDTPLQNAFGNYNFIDTAGLRRRSKVERGIEQYSVLRTTMAIERADVCLILIDATEGVTEQDTKVAGLAHESGKAAILVLNKWDLVDKDDKTLLKTEREVRELLPFLTYAPVLSISALTGQRTGKLFRMINHVFVESRKRVTTGQLNAILAEATARVQPPSDKGKRLKVLYMTQTGVSPPHFVVFVNEPELFHFSYRRYLENRIRDVYGFEGTPLRMTVKKRGEE